MDVVVLAGGFGTRLRPWTLHMPKPLVPILDRAMIQHVVDSLADVSVILNQFRVGDPILTPPCWEFLLHISVGPLLASRA